MRRDPNDANLPPDNYGGQPTDEGLTVQVSALPGIGITAIKHQHTGGGNTTGVARIADLITSNVNPSDPVYPWIGCPPHAGRSRRNCKWRSTARISVHRCDSSKILRTTSIRQS